MMAEGTEAWGPLRRLLSLTHILHFCPKIFYSKMSRLRYFPLSLGREVLGGS
jgi:hypothetical protein